MAKRKHKILDPIYWKKLKRQFKPKSLFSRWLKDNDLEPEDISYSGLDWAGCLSVYPIFKSKKTRLDAIFNGLTLIEIRDDNVTIWANFESYPLNELFGDSNPSSCPLPIIKRTNGPEQLRLSF